MSHDNSNKEGCSRDIITSAEVITHDDQATCFSVIPSACSTIENSFGIAGENTYYCAVTDEVTSSVIPAPRFTIYSTSTVQSITLHQVPIAMYILQIFNENITTGKTHNIQSDNTCDVTFAFAKVKPTTIERFARFFTGNMLNLNLCNRVRIHTSNTITLPEAFKITLLRDDDSIEQQILYPNSMFTMELARRTTALFFELDTNDPCTLELHIDNDKISIENPQKFIAVYFKEPVNFSFIGYTYCVAHKCTIKRVYQKCINRYHWPSGMWRNQYAS